MKRKSIPLTGLACLLSVFGSSAGAQVHPIVIELYQSQGCSSCPPANALLNSVSDRNDLLTLSFAVTYWDDLGWKDRFAKPEFTHRQYEYASGPIHAQVATPSMIINGRSVITGLDRQEFDRAVKNQPDLNGPELKAENGHLYIAPNRKVTQAQIWWVSYTPGQIDMAIGSGENAGRTLPQRHIVRTLKRLGTYTGKVFDVNLPSPDKGEAAAILLQAGKGGPILNALKL